MDLAIAFSAVPIYISPFVGQHYYKSLKSFLKLYRTKLINGESLYKIIYPLYLFKWIENINKISGLFMWLRHSIGNTLTVNLSFINGNLFFVYFYIEVDKDFIIVLTKS